MASRAKSSGEGFSVHSRSLLPECLNIISLLSQFKIQQVRDDFFKGAFKLPHRSKNVTLHEMDLLWLRLHPPWLGVEASYVRNYVTHARDELLDVIELKTDMFVLSLSMAVPMRTYAQWYSIIQDLSKCSYWQETSPIAASADENGVGRDKTFHVGTNTRPVQVADNSTNTVTISSKEVGTNMIPSSDISTKNENRVEVCSMTPVKQKTVMKSSFVAPTSSDNQSNKNNKTKLEISNGEIPLSVISESPISPAKLFKSAVKSDKLSCSFCSRTGHTENSCWRRRGLCIICGGHHHMRECSRYIAPPDATCSVCNGRHLGKVCKILSRLSLFCHWCGKRGHTESNCWVKAGACLICGSGGHMLNKCAKFVPRDTLSLPRWCADCGSQHIGTECYDPYME